LGCFCNNLRRDPAFPDYKSHTAQPYRNAQAVALNRCKLKTLRSVKSASPIVVLCLFDYLATTGFATVSQNIVKELRRRFGDRLHLDIIPINYLSKLRATVPFTSTTGMPYAIGQLIEVKEYHGLLDYEKQCFEQAETEIWEDSRTRILPISHGERINDAYGRFSLLRYLNDFDYDGCFIMQDPGLAVGMMPNLLEVAENRRKAGKKRTRTLFYFPIDSVPLSFFFNEEKEKDLSYFDSLVAYTEFGRHEVLKQRPDLAKKLRVIPHGCNPKHFYPIGPSARDAFRKEYFGEIAGRKFIIANINRNQFRKDIPSTILGFAEYKKRYDKSDVFLYLHMNRADLPMGWDLPVVLDQVGLKEGIDYGFPPEDKENAQTSIETLNKIYNACDLYLSTTTGEGWGLSVTEAMMCSLPVIAPYNTSLMEITGRGERAWLLQETFPYCAIYDSVIREQVNYLEVAERINEMRENPEMTKQKVTKALEYMQTLTWRKICYKWEEEFLRLFT
jgi:glycosyltransferase involved in cell wall biosynthesis